MKNTFNISFYARECKANKNGQTHVEIRISVNQQIFMVQLPFLVEAKKFNGKRQPKEYTDYVSLMRTRVNEILVDMLASEEPITAERIREYIRTGGYKSYTVDDMFKEYIEILRQKFYKDQLTRTVYRKYELVYEMFKERNDTTIEVNRLTQQMMFDFRNYLLEKYDQNTAVGYLTKLKSFIKYGISTGNLKTNPTQYVNIKRVRKEIDYLTEDQLNQLIDLRLENSSLQGVLDLFLFEASSGISYADIQNLTPSDVQIENGVYYITKKRVKTGTEFTAVVLPFGVKILEKYNYNLKKISNQKLNAYLKVIGDIAGLNTNLHTHLARHTYLTYLLNKGVSIEVVAKAAGHTNTSVTQQFYAQIQKSTVVSEIAKILN